MQSETTAEHAHIDFEGASETIGQSLRQIWHDFLGHVALIVAGLIVLAITALIAMALRKVTHRAMRPVRIRRSLKDLAERFVVITLWVVGLLLAAMIVLPGIEPGDALAALGIGSVAVGLAFKDIFENFFAGVLILWRFPFENGDFIECDGLSGKVVDVTIRNTLLRTVEGDLVVIPNATIYKNAVDILTYEKKRRQTVIAGIAYGEKVAPAREVIRKAVESCPTVARGDGTPIEIFAQEFASSSINFEVTWWTGSTPLEQRRSRDEVVEAVKTALDEAGIEIPFPYRTLTFKQPLQLLQQRGEDGEDGEDSGHSERGET